MGQAPKPRPDFDMLRLIRKPSVRIEKTKGKPESRVVLAEAITSISKSLKALKKSGVNEEAIIILLRHDTNLARVKIELVLDCLETLEKRYCRS